MLAYWVMDTPVEEVSQVQMCTVGKHGKNCFDNGSLKLRFTNGVKGSSRFHQALPGHQDDIYVCVTFKDGIVNGGWKHIMFRMEWSPDGLYFSKEDGDIEDSGQWSYQPIAPTDTLKANLKEDKVDWLMDALRFNPPGHMEGWCEGWRRMLEAICGFFWKKLEKTFAANLKGRYALPAPTFSTIGEHSMRYIGAVIQCQECAGTVALADVK